MLNYRKLPNVPPIQFSGTSFPKGPIQFKSNQQPSRNFALECKLKTHKETNRLPCPLEPDLLTINRPNNFFTQ